MPPIARDRDPGRRIYGFFRDDQVFFPLVTDDMVPRLREIAFEGVVGRNGYNVAAVYLLAEYGDLETARQLRALAKEQGLDDKIVTHVGGYVWMIDSQHNPDMLLAHIRSKGQNNLRTQLWALKHAIALGLDKDGRRSALLEYTLNLRPETKHDAFAARIRELAVENHILKPGEFPVFPETSQDRLITNLRRAIGSQPPQK